MSDAQSYPQVPSIAVSHADSEERAHIERLDRAMLNQPRRNNRPEREELPSEAPSPKVPARASTPAAPRDKGVVEAPLLGRGGRSIPPERTEEARKKLVESLKKSKPPVDPARVKESRKDLADAYREAVRRKKDR